MKQKGELHVIVVNSFTEEKTSKAFVKSIFLLQIRQMEAFHFVSVDEAVDEATIQTDLEKWKEREERTVSRANDKNRR